MTELKQVTIYTDGACSGNPGPGGYGTILVHGDRRKELSGGFKNTTNNRMEMMALIVGLRSLTSPCQVSIYSDSKYVIEALRLGWAKSWRKKNWKKSDGKPAANQDLWQALLELTEKHRCSYHWVEGHAGHPENERCDELAVAASLSDNLLEDRPPVSTIR